VGFSFLVTMMKRECKKTKEQKKRGRLFGLQRARKEASPARSPHAGRAFLDLSHCEA
jgi:hypothetical protein